MPETLPRTPSLRLDLPGAVLFLASDDSAMLTASAMAIEGGPTAD